MRGEPAGTSTRCEVVGESVAGAAERLDAIGAEAFSEFYP
jgi:hypothetical protein